MIKLIYPLHETIRLARVQNNSSPALWPLHTVQSEYGTSVMNLQHNKRIIHLISMFIIVCQKQFRIYMFNQRITSLLLTDNLEVEFVQCI